jgi:integrase
MATFSQLPSGKWRAQVRRPGFYKGATFTLKRDAEAWGREIERQAEHVVTGGFAPIPKGATVSDLIDLYRKQQAQAQGRTKTATLEMLKREIGRTPLGGLNATTLRDLIDRRTKQGAGGVTIAADLSFLSAVLKWGRHARRLDIPDRLALDARESLKHRGLRTRPHEREREPTDAELARLYAHWATKPRQKIDMPTLCRLALATGMRLGELCALQVEDIDREARTIIIRDRKDPRQKIGNNQKVPLLPEAWAIVQTLIDGREDGPVFPARPASASTAFTRACADVVPPIRDLHFHDLRHRATAQFFRMGLDIPRVALLTGHKTWAMLRRYTDIKPGDVHAVVDRPKAGRLGATR